MFCKRTEALLAAALSLGLSGCLTPFARPADPPAQRVVDQVESESPTTDHLAIVDAAAEMERRDNLARVEAFLERTREAEVQHPSAQSDRLASRDLDRRDTQSQVRGDSLRREADPARSNPAEPVDRSARTHERSPERVVANQHVELEAVAPDDPMPAKPVVKSVFIRSGAIDRGRSEPVLDPQVTNAPIDIRGARTGPTLTQLVDELADRLVGTDDIDEQWRLTLIRLALGEDQAAGEISENLSLEARRILSTFVSAATAARRAARDPQMVAASDLESAGALHSAMMELADPVVESITFCRRVSTFGVYDEMDDADFVAGRSTPTIVYCEVRNLASSPTADGQHRTLVGTQMRIMTADGRTVWEEEVPEIEDLCRRRRGDFFLAKRIALPSTLQPGEYVLKVFVEDKLSGKGHEGVHRFRIGPVGTKLAGS